MNRENQQSLEAVERRK